MTVLLIFGLEETKYVRTEHLDKNAYPLEGRDDKAEEPSDPVEEGSLSVPTTNESTSKAFEVDHSIPMRTYSQRLSLFGSATKCSLRQFLRLFYEPAVVLWQFPAILLGACQYG